MPEPTSADARAVAAHRAAPGRRGEALARMLHRQVAIALTIGDLELDGQVVHPEVLVSGRASGGRVALRPRAALAGAKRWRTEPLDAYRGTEPRLPWISTVLGTAVRTGSLRIGDVPVEANAWRLRDLRRWARYPSASLHGNLGEFTSACSCKCTFCFLDGNDQQLGKRAILTLQEARTRARYYRRAERLGLPTPAGTPGEPFAHPRALELLRVARDHDPTATIDVTTNGDFLTEALVEHLRGLKPILVTLSLNVADVARRREVMRSLRPEVGIRAVPLLARAGIQFQGSIVATPDLAVDELRETILFLDAHAPIQIRMLLPGFTRFARPQPTSDLKARWDEVVALVADLRTKVRSPILVQPASYAVRALAPAVEGVIPGSPADAAGVRIGDRILSVDGKSVVTRGDAIALLAGPRRRGEPWEVRVVLERAGRQLEVLLSNELVAEDDRSPYKPPGYAARPGVLGRFKFGIFISETFELGVLRTLKKILDDHPEARRVLVFTTPLMKGLMAQAISLTQGAPEFALAGRELRLTVATHDHWGGNIQVGDLHVVQDYVNHLRRLEDAGYRPDLAIVPRTFANEWGHDVLGRSCMEIERCTGIHVEFLRMRRIME